MTWWWSSGPTWSPRPPPNTAPAVGALPAVLLPLAQDPAHSALCLDFDGTLSPIVADPVGARPWPGVPALLARLAARFAVVAVISGRPADFLHQVLGSPPGVTLIGLYGLGQVGPDAGPWASVISASVARARAEAPPGVYVEPKGFTVTLHWRNAPEAGPWVTAFAADEGRQRGLIVHPGRMSLELRPPLEVDKGTVVRSLVEGMRAVAVFGDDLGDLPAFAAVTSLAARGVAVARVAVIDAESDDRVRAQADLEVQGPAGAVALLDQLAREAVVSG
jgi:trehalose 6-phosphate phosphatase